MSRNLWTTLGTLAGVGGVVGATLLWSRRARAAGVSTPTAEPSDAPPQPLDLAPLPRPQDVQGDLARNWGTTPLDLRPLLLTMEEAARIPGSARLLGVFAFGESRFVSAAHNGNAPDEEAERKSSRRAYDDHKANNPPLKHGERAADFGSGGLFGQLAPYFLWTGVPELGDKAPLLGAPPELLFQPRAAAFGAIVYLQRLLKHYRIDDHADLRAGWASPSLLTTGRGSPRYGETRARFLDHAKTVGIDLADTTTIPTRLDASGWPGVPAVFTALVGSLPKEAA